MYTSLVNVQIILSLLKQNNIRHMVLSPGTRNAPLVHSVETDPYFTCYSIVDERSAAYFALGLSEALHAPVCLSCTSSTASCNYLPAIQEASQKNIQLVALTADRDYRLLNQMEDQMIDQISMYRGNVRKSVNLPIVKEKDDIWFCERSVNEALYALKAPVQGPVQINFQVSSLGTFSVPELPVYRKIHVVEDLADSQTARQYQDILRSKKRILILCGQNYSEPDNLSRLLDAFVAHYPAVVSKDTFSNLQSERFLKTVLVTEAMDFDEFKLFLPDLVITIGLHNWSFIKYRLRYYAGHFEHWRVAPDGYMLDGFKSLTHVFKCSPEQFFAAMNDGVAGDGETTAGGGEPTTSITVPTTGRSERTDNSYYQQWEKRVRSVKYPDLRFSNFSVIRDAARLMPARSLLHLSILNSVRLANYATPDESISTFGNLGADGIDGALSTFLGQSSIDDRLSFLIIGDLSFMYDLNASQTRMKNYQRILLINNFSGSEFHNNFGLKLMPTLNQHVAASHQTRLADWVEMMNVDYHSAANQDELDATLPSFVAASERPILLEVFTDAETDSRILKTFYAMNRIQTKTKLVKRVLRKLKRMLGINKGISQASTSNDNKG